MGPLRFEGGLPPRDCVLLRRPVASLRDPSPYATPLPTRPLSLRDPSQALPTRPLSLRDPSPYATPLLMQATHRTWPESQYRCEIEKKVGHYGM
eukprot:COSAG02_NODE_1362_length_13050_cov_22.164775_2_plen_94_part_00